MGHFYMQWTFNRLCNEHLTELQLRKKNVMRKRICLEDVMLSIVLAYCTCISTLIWKTKIYAGQVGRHIEISLKHSLFSIFRDLFSKTIVFQVRLINWLLYKITATKATIWRWFKQKIDIIISINRLICMLIDDHDRINNHWHNQMPANGLYLNTCIYKDFHNYGLWHFKPVL